MFYPDAFKALAQIARHLALEGSATAAAACTSTQKAQYLRAAEAGDGVVEQMRVKPLQRRRIAEHHVAGILALARAPVIRKRQRAANFLVHGMKVAHQLIAYRRPIGLQLAIK